MVAFVSESGIIWIVLKAVVFGLGPAILARRAGRSFFLWWLYGAIPIVGHAAYIHVIFFVEPKPFEDPLKSRLIKLFRWYVAFSFLVLCTDAIEMLAENNWTVEWWVWVAAAVALYVWAFLTNSEAIVYSNDTSDAADSPMEPLNASPHEYSRWSTRWED